MFCIGSKGWGPLGTDPISVPAIAADATMARVTRLELGMERVGIVEGASGITADELGDGETVPI